MMAQFRATIKGKRGMASRLGTKASGMVATINGWNEGITVTATHRDGRDIFTVWVTAGSNGGRTPTMIYHDGECN